ncbi:pyrimidine reductase, partial [Gaiella sp. SCGC AG-212-M14]
ERGPDGDKFKLDEVLEADALLLGRKTYDGFAKAWPTVTDEVGFAEKMNSMPKYVVSNTLELAEWNNSTVINGDVAEEVAKLEGNILVAGSAQLVQTLMDHDLVDEYRLMIYPVLLGSGKRLFKDGVDTTALQIVETNQTGQVATVVLRRAA